MWAKVCPLLQSKRCMYYIFWVCVCVVCMCVWVCVYVCILTYPRRNAHAPYDIAICGLSLSPYFSSLFHKRNDFRGKKSKSRVLTFSTLPSETFLTVRRTGRDMIRKPYCSSCKALVTRSCQIFNKTWNFLTDFSERTQIHISWKSVKSEPRCSMTTDGQANSRFPQMCESANN